MGNIEIREQSNPIRRTQIFTERKSYDQIKVSPRNSLTQRPQYHPALSPIRYAKKPQTSKNLPLTERKINVDLKDKLNDESNLNQFTSSPFYKQNQRSNKINSAHDKDSTFFKIKSFENENFPSQLEEPVTSFNLSGKIVSNSRRVNQQKKAIQFMNSTLNKQLVTQRQNILQSPYDNREIIKKVRNFNDFLNEIKRKLKQDKHQNLLRNKYLPQTFNKTQIPKKVSQQQFQVKNTNKNNLQQPSIKEEKNLQKTKSTRKIQVALKLQNQKLQLQKYRKLVQRELSKTHSIQNISLCTKGSGQKILTIQYESILPYNILSIQNSKSTIKQQPFESSQNQKNSSLHSYFVDEGQNNISKEKNLIHKKSSEKVKQREMVNKLKNQYEKIRKNMMNLGKLIEKYENSLEDNEEEKSQQKILIREESIIDAFSQLSSQKNLKNPLIVQNHLKENGEKIIYKQNSLDMNPKVQRIDSLFERLQSLQNEYQQTDRQIREAIENSNSQSFDSSYRQKFSSFAPNQNEQIN